MHGLGGEERKRSRHMWKVSHRGTSIVVADDSSSSPNSFLKEGRKIVVGDCALFKPPQDSPPFIGIIRWLTTCKENKLKLGVNWLYRASEVKLGKGIHLEAAPNEVFYSFHKDEIPAASLLHPCKVAFLPKGVALPSGISSFVCRQVYDITNKCLWWLTDQDYIDERQQEVDQLLNKTRIEMHATMQPGGRSPKPVSVPTSTSQLKASSDSVQNSASVFPSSQVKGKKRERGEQGFEPMKRERSAKADDGDSANCRLESNMKSEIAKITEKGGLVDSEGVEILVQLLLTDRSEKKIDLAGRSMLAGVVAATDKLECLNQFVRLKGLPVFDEWLQEVHKGKIGDFCSPKESDKLIEEFLLILLRALDKLPVNLPELQMCNIGKSVNHLRTHKNLEIQKKARSLVDTWKKRVEAEMNINDAKSGSSQTVAWSGKARLSEVSPSGRNQGLSSDVAIKSSFTQLCTSKTTSVKLVQDEGATRSASVSPGSIKSVASPASTSTNSKDGPLRTHSVGAPTDLPQTTARDEKSSSSSQSHNNGQCFSEHGKSGGKEYARSSTAASMCVIKISRHGKSVNESTGSAVGSGRGSNHKNTASGTTNEKALDGPVVEGNSHKLIVKISNRGRNNPAQISSGGSPEDPTVMGSRASSPVLSDKQDHCDRSSKEKNDSLRANINSDMDTESKDLVTGSDNGEGSPAAVNGEGCCKTGEEPLVSKAASLPVGNEHKSMVLQETAFKSGNVLTESSVKHSRASTTTSGINNVGTNLPVSVVTEDLSKSDLISSIDSLHKNSTVVNESPKEELARDEKESSDGVDIKCQGIVTGSIGAKSWDPKPTTSKSEDNPDGEQNGHSNTSGAKVNENVVDAVAIDNNGNKSHKETKKTDDEVNGDYNSDSKPRSCSSSADEGKGRSPGSTPDVESEAIVGKPRTNPSLEVNGGKNNSSTNELLNDIALTEQISSYMMPSDSAKGTTDEALQTSHSMKDPASENASKMITEEDDKTEAETDVNQIEKQQSECDVFLASETKGLVGLATATTNHDGENKEEVLEMKAVNEKNDERGDKKRPLTSSNLTGIDAEESSSSAADTSSVSAVGVAVDKVGSKVEFDLNEGLNVDGKKCGEEPNNWTTPVKLMSPLPYPVSSVSSSLSAPVTVAAAAKGPFVPPDDLLRSKGELGWKGSAPTSAFRPAEPRKALELLLAATSSSPIPDSTTGKSISRLPLDIDLNIPDERVLEDMNPRESCPGTSSWSEPKSSLDLTCGIGPTVPPVRGFGGLDLDLNRSDEAPEATNLLAKSIRRVGIPVGNKLSSLQLNGDAAFCRGFDLNGPMADEPSVEPSSFSQNSRRAAGPAQPPVSGLWMNNAEMGSFSSWFSPGNTYPAVAIPSIMPDRATVEQPFPIIAASGPPTRMLGPTNGSSSSGPFSPDVCRGSVLSSSPALPFASSSFQYSDLPFGNSFPMQSTTSFSGSLMTYTDSPSGSRLYFPAVHSQFLGPSGAVSTHYPRPYVTSLSDASNNNNTGAELNKKWGRQGLDLNAGPGAGPDMEGRDESSPLALRQLSVSGSNGLPLKRKEPEGGWDAYK